MKTFSRQSWGGKGALLPALLVAACVFVSAAAARAHDGEQHGGDAGVTTAAPGGGAVLVPPTRFEIKILDASQNDPLQGGEVPLENAQVKATVTRGEDVVFQEAAHKEEIAGVYGAQGTLDENGAHVLRWEVKPASSGEAFVVEFPLQVAGAPQQRSVPFLSGWRLAAVGASAFALLLAVFALGRLSGGGGRRGNGKNTVVAAALLLVAALAGRPVSVRAHDGEVHGGEATAPTGATVADLKVGIGDTATAKQTKMAGKYRVTLTVKVLRPAAPDPNRVRLTAAQAQTIGVKTITVSGAAFDTGVAVTGTVQADPARTATIASRVPGRLRSVLANIGQRVRAGQTLATVESPDIADAQGAFSAAQSGVLARQAAFQQAEERARIAARQLAQQQELARAGAFSQAPVQQALSAQAEAGSDLATARADVAEAASELAQARADQAAHAKALQRVQELFDAGIRSRAELEAQQLEVTQDQAKVTQAEALVTQQRARVRQAETRAAVAAQTLRRERQIRGTNVLNRREIVQAQGALDTARLEARQAQADLNGARRAVEAARARLAAVGAAPGSGNQVTVTAPFDGIVTEREAAIGETVSPDKTLFTVLNPAVVVVEGDVFENDLPNVRAGMPARITTDAAPGKTFSGRIRSVGATVNPETRTTRARIVINNPGGVLRPGTFVRALLVATGAAARQPQSVSVPDEAVQAEGPLKIVYVQKGDTFERRTVTVGESAGGRTQIKSGLKPGEQVVTTGAYQLTAVSGA